MPKLKDIKDVQLSDDYMKAQQAAFDELADNLDITSGRMLDLAQRYVTYVLSGDKAVLPTDVPTPAVKQAADEAVRTGVYRAFKVTIQVDKMNDVRERLEALK